MHFARYLDSLIINMDNLSDGEIENVLAAITNNAKVQTYIYLRNIRMTRKIRMMQEKKENGICTKTENE